MDQLMTLKDFAQQCGVSPATARSWKARGKITQDDSGEWRVAMVGGEIPAVAIPNLATRATEGATTLQDVVATLADAQRVAVAPDIAMLQREIATLSAGVAALQAEIATLQDRVDALESAPVIDRTASDLIAHHRQRSNYAGSQARYGAAFDDCVTPYDGDYPQ